MEDVLSVGFFNKRCAEIEGRVSPKRLKHIEGVSATAAKLANIYGVNVRKARLAGLLHDWDKGYRDEAIRARAHELGVDVEVGSWVVEHMPEVLHGPTAAAALSRDFPGIPDDVLDAIRFHTVARMEMTDLDKIIYIADAIEPSRKFDAADEMRSLVGKVTLNELYYRVYKFWTLSLVERDFVLHPNTIAIWNSIAKGKSKARKARFQ